ncbi:hypothetical protein ACWEP5_36570 [Nocardia niigatensis]
MVHAGGADTTASGPLRRGLGPLSFAVSDRATAATATLSLLARLPGATLGIALPLLILAHGSSPATAGATLAVHRCAQAVATPAWGYAADRVRLALILRVAVPLYGTVGVLLPHLTSGAAVLVAAALTGLMSLPYSALMRALWNRRFEDPAQQAAAGTYESFLTEAVLLGGRAVVVVALLTVPVAMVVTAQSVLAVLGAVALSTTGHLRADQPVLVRKAASRKAFRYLPLLPVYGGFLGLSASLGAFATAVIVAYSAGAGRGSWAAAAILCWGLGSLVGVGPFTRWTAALPGTWGVVALTTGMAAAQIVAAVTVSAGHSLVLLACFLAGLPVAAIVTGVYAELARLSPLGRQSSAFAWATTCLFAGDAVGAALAGIAADLADHRLGMFAVAVGFAFLAAVAELSWPASREQTVRPGQPGP